LIMMISSSPSPEPRQGGIASVTSEGPTTDLAEPENAAGTGTEDATTELEGLKAAEDDVVLAAASPRGTEEAGTMRKTTLSANVGGVLLGLCGIAALLACAALLSQLVAARYDRRPTLK
jgi:hypothetical protein